MKKFMFLGITALFMVSLFGACSNPSGGDTGGDSNGGDGGIFTMNGIPNTYEGMYAELGLPGSPGSASVTIGGAQSYSYNAGITTTTLVKISNGSVSLPMWVLTTPNNIARYTGSDTINVVFIIYNTQTVKSSDMIMPSATRSYTVSFSNGNATQSW